MRTIQVTDNLQQCFSDLERESLIAIGVADLIRMLHSAAGTGDALESFDEGIWLIGDIATDNAARIAALTENIINMELSESEAKS